MRIAALAGGVPAALAQALAVRGVDPVRAEAAADGAVGLRLLLDGLDEDDSFALFRAARAAGVDCRTGEGWAVLDGSRARLAGLARPGEGVRNISHRSSAPTMASARTTLRPAGTENLARK